ncbi:MAG: tyrosine-type recombinase/integrase [Muribaculaceae bacterium]
MPPIDEFTSYLRLELNRSPLTVEAYHRDICQFADWITCFNPDRFAPSDITLNDIRTWMASLARNGVSPRSIRRKTQSLRAFFRFLHKRGDISTNPTTDISLPRLRKDLPDVVRAEEVEGILRLQDMETEAKPDDEDALRDNLIVDILYSLGIRRAELIAISDPDIDFFSSEIKITGKRSKQRIVPVPPPLLDKIKAWQQLRDRLWPDLPQPRPLFVVKGKRISPERVYRTVNKELQPTSARRKSPHALRHSFATAMLNEGAEINSVKEFLGHSSLATTQIYTHVSFSEMKKAYFSAHPRAKSGMESRTSPACAHQVRANLHPDEEKNDPN